MSVGSFATPGKSPMPVSATAAATSGQGLSRSCPRISSTSGMLPAERETISAAEAAITSAGSSVTSPCPVASTVYSPRASSSPPPPVAALPAPPSAVSATMTIVATASPRSSRPAPSIAP